MAFYHNKILPKLIKAAMSDKRLAPYRRSTLAPCFGKVLELGIGSGANLEFYPESVCELVGIEPHAGLLAVAAERLLINKNFTVELVQASAEELPFASNSFDFVVSTFTLCSVFDSTLVTKEVARVLKPNGKLLYLEHGLSHSPSVKFFQKHLNPIQKAFAGGCQLTKNHVQDVENGGLSHLSSEQFFLPKVPKFLGFIYQGSATPIEKS
jgi:ubiquinone/menaquinone biosynthesis C-methylase UbiE